MPDKVEAEIKIELKTADIEWQNIDQNHIQERIKGSSNKRANNEDGSPQKWVQLPRKDDGNDDS